MNVTLLHNSPLEVVVKAIRKCYASEGKSDSGKFFRGHDDSFKDAKWKLGPKDKALIRRIIKSDHTSTLEHLTFSFDIDGLSRAALQELARHRHASLSVKSTRYTLQELCKAIPIGEFLVKVGDVSVDTFNMDRLIDLRNLLMGGGVCSNDEMKYMLPEAFKTSLIWTINARSLRNFLKLRSSKGALWEMRDLAEEVFKLIPNDMKFVFEDYVEEI
jgi:thymidylate synthase (FAD)